MERQGTPGNEAKPPCLCSSRAGRSQNPEVLAEEQMFCFKKMILSGSLRCSESSTIPSSPLERRWMEGADRLLPSGRSAPRATKPNQQERNNRGAGGLGALLLMKKSGVRINLE